MTREQWQRKLETDRRWRRRNRARHLADWSPLALKEYRKMSRQGRAQYHLQPAEHLPKPQLRVGALLIQNVFGHIDANMVGVSWTNSIQFMFGRW